jgi:predicted AlkP superfamily pyrophosphatase or phosphodiesterase
MLRFVKRITFVLLLISMVFAQKPYVILVSFDAFRWDYPNRGLTPNFKLIENEGVRASSLQPCFPSKTFPNHYSIITGMYPENHGIISNYFINPITGEEYSMGNKETVRDCKWYLGEAFWETAKRYGIKTASFFWPGSEVNDQSRQPDYIKYYDKKVTY